MMANNAAIAPLGEAKPNTEIFRLLAARMGFDDPCFREATTSSRPGLRQTHARAMHFDWESLKRKGWQKLACRTRRSPKAASRRRPANASSIPRRCWPTASIRCRPISAVRIGGQQSGTGARYPLAMISPPARNFLNSTFVNVKSLRATEGEPHLDIHPDDARIARHRRRRHGPHLQRPRLVRRQGARDRQGARGPGGGPVVWWKKLARTARTPTK
jgi:anaerobic selenocysteine-containing dehydrogenase